MSKWHKFCFLTARLERNFKKNKNPFIFLLTNDFRYAKLIYNKLENALRGFDLFWG